MIGSDGIEPLGVHLFAQCENVIRHLVAFSLSEKFFS